MYNYYVNDYIEQTISFINLSKKDNYLNIPNYSQKSNLCVKEDLRMLEEDVKIEEEYLDYLFHYNK